MARIRERSKKDGSPSYMVCWRDPKTRASQGLTVATRPEAETLKRLLDANGQSFQIAQHAILTNAKRTPTVAEVVQEHIDLLIRPSSGTTKTYQTMLDRNTRESEPWPGPRMNARRTTCSGRCSERIGLPTRTWPPTAAITGRT